MTESNQVDEPPQQSNSVQKAAPKVLTAEEKKQLWTKRIIGAIVIWSLTGCAVLFIASQAVAYLFKTILTP